MWTSKKQGYNTYFNLILRYSRVMKATCLLEDLDTFPAGDMSEIGAKGSTVSGGIYNIFKIIVIMIFLGPRQTYENETKTKTVSKNHKISTIEHTTDNLRNF